MGTFTNRFTEALVTIFKLWNQSRCSSTEKRIKKMCYIYKLKYYSAIKKDEIVSLAGK
jgi:hypothetical protein